MMSAKPPETGAAQAAASDEGAGMPLSHLNERGEAHMVDVSEKSVTHRTASAQGLVYMKPETLALIETGRAKKGDVLATARIAGIMAAKKTHELIPLCHPLAITKARVDFEMLHEPARIKVTAEVKVSGQTGVEMEALTAVSVACLTIYDMLKAADKAMRFSDIALTEKIGGRSGHYRAGEADAAAMAGAESAALAGSEDAAYRVAPNPEAPKSSAGSKTPAASKTPGPPAKQKSPSGQSASASASAAAPADPGDPPWDI